MAVENPQHLQISWSHLYCEGVDALIKVTAFRADRDLRTPVPLLISVRKDAGGKWHVIKTAITLVPHGKEVLLRGGYPPSLTEGIPEDEDSRQTR